MMKNSKKRSVGDVRCPQSCSPVSLGVPDYLRAEYKFVLDRVPHSNLSRNRSTVTFLVLNGSQSGLEHSVERKGRVPSRNSSRYASSIVLLPRPIRWTAHKRASYLSEVSGNGDIPLKRLANETCFGDQTGHFSRSTRYSAKS